jgi:penicillin-binding protein 1A
MTEKFLFDLHLTKSKNTAAVQVAEKLGFSNLDHYFSQFFFPDSKEKNRRFRNDLSLALGSLEISPLEMASAFSAFGNEGRIVRPFLIRRILNPQGKVIYTNENKDEFDLKVPNERKVLKPDTSEVILSSVKG